MAQCSFKNSTQHIKDFVTSKSKSAKHSVVCFLGRCCKALDSRISPEFKSKIKHRKEVLAPKFKSVKNGLVCFWSKTCNVLNHKFSSIIAFVASLLIFLIGYLVSVPNVMLIAVSLFLLFAALFCLAKVNDRILSLIFLFVIFTFLLSRPIISFFRGNKWWYFSEKTIALALLTILLSMAFVIFGTQIAKLIIEKLPVSRDTENTVTFYPWIQSALYIGLIILFIIRMCNEFDTYVQIKSLSYVGMYTGELQALPIWIRIPAGLYEYVAVANLVLMPNKKKTYLILLTFVIVPIPTLLSGARFKFILHIMFAVIYILIRNIINKEQKWITKRMVSFAVVMVFVLILSMSAINYAREDSSASKAVQDKNTNLITDFFYLQGTSFDTVCQGFEYESDIRALPGKPCYTLSAFIDYFNSSTLGKIILGENKYTGSNSMEMVKYSSSLSHRLSYVVMPEKYLAGHGRGSSYILETYFDGGFVLLIIFSILIGIFLTLVPHILNFKNFYVKLIVLTTMINFYSMPRASAFEFLQFIIKPQFWIVVVALVLAQFVTKHQLINKIMVKLKSLQNIKRKNIN